jgi:hypothetical protein
MRTAMSCPVGRPESSIPCSPPTDPAMFIYPANRAAPAENQEDRSSPKTSYQGVAYVSSSVGGSLSTLSFHCFSNDEQADGLLLPARATERGRLHPGVHDGGEVSMESKRSMEFMRKALDGLSRINCCSR